MAGSLRDQLVKAGLATPDQARKAERKARSDKQSQRKARAKSQGKGQGRSADKQSSGPAEPSPAQQARARAATINHEKAERDRAQMRAIADRARAHALRAEIRQIIQAHDQRVSKASDDDVPYNFVHGKRVKRIYVPPAQREQLSKGTLVIVNNDGNYHLLPARAAEKIRQRDPKRIIVANDGSTPAAGSDDEYYARFQVPDDLDW